MICYNLRYIIVWELEIITTDSFLDRPTDPLGMENVIFIISCVFTNHFFWIHRTDPPLNSSSSFLKWLSDLIPDVQNPDLVRDKPAPFDLSWANSRLAVIILASELWHALRDTVVKTSRLFAHRPSACNVTYSFSLRISSGTSISWFAVSIGLLLVSFLFVLPKSGLRDFSAN